jgi:hypothetical protein
LIVLLIGSLLLACGGKDKKPPLLPDDPNTPTPVLMEGGAAEDAGW